ncbi:cupin-like domain-containing protein [Congregibacter sp.]|uniref:cupin-like domain-containing protein n=1 Tax=Congregibacter sp. TaxID=2744308 RepID=UPI003F6B649F
MQPAGSLLAREETAPLSWKAIPAIAHGDGVALRDAIRNRRPMVIMDLAADWPALKRWTPEDLSSQYGHHEVPVYDLSFANPGDAYMSSKGTMTLAEFLEKTQSQGQDLRMFLYNLSQKIPSLLDDIHFPDVGLKFSRRFVFSFFGCQGSTTPLHYDIDMGDVLHTAIQGRRRIRLFSPQSSRAIYQHPFTVRSYVNLSQPDYGQFPALAYADGYEVILEPGQTLYMPSGWWHEFYYLDAGVGVSLRAPSPLWLDRVKGVNNLLLDTIVDRLANYCAPQRWFAWKTRRAAQLANSQVNKNAIGRPVLAECDP